MEPQDDWPGILPPRRIVDVAENQHAAGTREGAERPERREDVRRVNEDVDLAARLLEHNVGIGPDIGPFLPEALFEVVDDSADAQPASVVERDDGGVGAARGPDLRAIDRLAPESRAGRQRLDFGGRRRPPRIFRPEVAIMQAGAARQPAPPGHFEPEGIVRFFRIGPARTRALACFVDVFRDGKQRRIAMRAASPAQRRHVEFENLAVGLHRIAGPAMTGHDQNARLVQPFGAVARQRAGRFARRGDALDPEAARIEAHDLDRLAWRAAHAHPADQPYLAAHQCGAVISDGRENLGRIEVEIDGAVGMLHDDVVVEIFPCAARIPVPARNVDDAPVREGDLRAPETLQAPDGTKRNGAGLMGELRGGPTALGSPAPERVLDRLGIVGPPTGDSRMRVEVVSQ